MGKSSLFSRVALSPRATVGGDKKGNNLSISKPNQSINDAETQASSALNNNMGKTVRSTTTTTTFKDAIQRGVLSGVGILKK